MASFTPSTDNKLIEELRDSVRDLNKSTEFSSWVMIILTFVLVILTVILIIR